MMDLDLDSMFRAASEHTYLIDTIQQAYATASGVYDSELERKAVILALIDKGIITGEELDKYKAQIESTEFWTAMRKPIEKLQHLIDLYNTDNPAFWKAIENGALDEISVECKNLEGK